MIISYKKNLVLRSTALVCGLFIQLPASALNITSGQLIQTVNPATLKNSSSMTVSDFFDNKAISGRERSNIIEDTIFGPQPAPTQKYIYAVHSENFAEGEPSWNSSMNSIASRFSFDPNNFANNDSLGQIGLGGVMRFSLAPTSKGTPRYFVLGNWSLEYDAGRKDNFDFDKDPSKPITPNDFGVSGWHMRNHFDFPAVGFDMLNTTFISNADSFYLSGELGWSPEMTKSFFPGDSLYKAVSSFVFCGQDDAAMSNNSAEQIPCVFPQITANGQTDSATIASATQANLSVDLGMATTTAYPKADYFVAFDYEGVFYWLNTNFEWTSAAGPAYQGELIDLQSISIPNPTLPTGETLPSGANMTVYFGVDATPNGTFDAPYRFSSVSLHIK